jgi:uroporphyrinogen-III synthase
MLFDFATQLGMADALQNALKNKVTIASVGEVTSRALAELNLTPAVVPAQSKMGPLAQAVADYFQKT